MNVAVELPSNPLGHIEAAAIRMPEAPSRRLQFGATLLCALGALAALATCVWIIEREAVSRLAAIQRSLLAADAHAARLVTLADAVMLTALWGLDGRNLATMSIEQLAAIRLASLESAPGPFTLDIWRPDGESPVSAPDIRGPEREEFRYQIGPERDAPERASMTDPTRQIFVAAPINDPRTHELRIHLSRPVVGQDGNPQGVVSVGIPVASFTDIYAALLDRDGDRIALYRADRVRLAQFPSDEGIDDALWRRMPKDGEVGRFEWRAKRGATPMLTVFCRLDPLPLVITYTVEWPVIPWGALFADWPILVIMLVLFAAAIGYGRMSTRYAAALHRSNAELARAQGGLKLEAEGRAIFIAKMNHELRTPLNAIVGFAQILADGLFGPLGHPKYREYACDIAGSGQHLLMLIGDIIDFSSIDVGSRTLERVPLDAGETIGELVRLLRPVAGERGIELRAKGQPLWVCGDAVSVRQILMNLVSNAVKFAPAGSAVELACASDPATGHVALSVSDDGPGIAPEELASIGRPFYRTRASRDGAVPGSGLGLSISTALAHRMGGRLTLASTPGAGTTVTLFMPSAFPVEATPA
jgi:signal transduction histidine kinase